MFCSTFPKSGFGSTFLKVDYMVYVEVKLFFDEHVRESGEGYYPVVSPSYGMVPIKETFFLNANGCWIQQNTHILGNNIVDKLFANSMEKYIAIQGLYNGKELLELLNSRVLDAKGHTIKNNLGIRLYSVVEPTCITTDKWTLNW
jgi:hypothetical protein